MKNNNHPKQEPKFHSWVAKKSKGKEKQYIIYMLVFSFLLMGSVVAMRFIQDEPEASNYDLNIKTKPVQVSDVSIDDFMYKYSDTSKDKELLALLEKYQQELDKTPIDTIAIKEIQNELKKYQGHYENN